MSGLCVAGHADQGHAVGQLWSRWKPHWDRSVGLAMPNIVGIKTVSICRENMFTSLRSFGSLLRMLGGLNMCSNSWCQELRLDCGNLGPKASSRCLLPYSASSRCEPKLGWRFWKPRKIPVVLPTHVCILIAFGCSNLLRVETYNSLAS